MYGPGIYLRFNKWQQLLYCDTYTPKRSARRKSNGLRTRKPGSIPVTAAVQPEQFTLLLSVYVPSY